MGHEYEERKAELESKGKWVNKNLLRFAFGNTYEEVENPKRARSNKSEWNYHRWTMFVAFNDDKELTSKYIKSVTYYLVPGFKPRKIKVTNAPFLLSRVGWGYFTVEMDIEFQAWTKTLCKIRSGRVLIFNKPNQRFSLAAESTLNSNIVVFPRGLR